MLENDLLDAIIALPTDLFYNTGIATYIWILDNDKPTSRRGSVQLVDATDQWAKMRKSLGSKRREISAAQVEHIVKLYGTLGEGSDASKLFRTRDFGYTTITVERPLQLNWALTDARLEAALSHRAFTKLLPPALDEIRSALGAGFDTRPPSSGATQPAGLADTRWLSSTERSEARIETPTTDLASFAKSIKQSLAAAGITLPPPQLKALLAGLSERDDAAPVITDTKGNPVPDPDLRDTENVPLAEDIDEYIAREIVPHVENFWVDRSKDRVGYEIPFTRHFYKYEPPRSLDEIDADLNQLVREITVLLEQVERA